MTWEAYQLTAIINLATCLAICASCLCRLNARISKRNKYVRLGYGALLLAAAGFGFGPLWGQWPTIDAAAFAYGVLLYLALTAKQFHRDSERGA